MDILGVPLHQRLAAGDDTDIVLQYGCVYFFSVCLARSCQWPLFIPSPIVLPDQTLRSTIQFASKIRNNAGTRSDSQHYLNLPFFFCQSALIHCRS